jgi:hypothetical protein
MKREETKESERRAMETERIADEVRVKGPSKQRSFARCGASHSIRLLLLSADAERESQQRRLRAREWMQMQQAAAGSSRDVA